VVYLFGYGSLAAHGAVPCVLRRHRRRWDVAMDNTRDLPGYKYFVDARTGERPAVFVSFLNLVRSPGDAVNGVVFPAGERLPLFDRRERNYARHDVSRDLDEAFDGPVFAYLGLDDARERFATGVRAGTAVISRAYHDKVRSDFAALGAEALARFDATTDAPAVPLRDLRRVDLPPHETV
jgi:hypothetical protein